MTLAERRRDLEAEEQKAKAMMEQRITSAIEEFERHTGIQVVDLRIQEDQENPVLTVSYHLPR